MSSWANYYEEKIIGHMLCGESFTPPSTFYAALFTANPGEAGGGTEATGGDYARQSCTFTRSGSVASNAALIEFPTSTADRSAITAVGFFDASTSGNMIAYKVLSTSKTYNTGQKLQIAIGSLTVTED